MKKLIIGIMTATTVLMSLNAYAIDVRLEFNNNTPKNLRPEGTITYSQDGVDHWNEPITPPTLFVPAHEQHAPADKLRTDLDDYYLEYFELYDENNKFLTNCLESYIAVEKNAVITFKLKQFGTSKPHYYCTYNVKYV